MVERALTGPTRLRPGRTRGVRGWPLWAHGAVLTLLLLALYPLMSPSSSFTSDEGAYALQVRALDEGSWAYPYKAGRFDTDGDWFPIVLSERGGAGFYPYVKHPAYPLTLRAGTAVAGETLGLHLPGLLGVVGTAAAAWLLAAALDPRLRAPAFWLAASGPVLVNGFIIWAHAPSAALAGLALVGAGRIVDNGFTRWTATGVGAAVVGGVLLRSEGLLFAAALAAALGAVRLRRAGPVHGVGAFAMVAVPALVATVVERRWIGDIMGAPYEKVAGQDGSSPLFGGRAAGAWHELLQGHFIDPSASVPVLAALAAVVGLGALSLRRHRAWSGRTLAAAVIVAVALLSVRFAAHPHDPVTGMMPAWPVAVLGLLLFRWRGGGAVVALLGGTLGLFTAGVLAMQYSVGGGLEWGGRYLFPALVPVAVIATAGLARAVAAMPKPDRRLATSLLGSLAVATSVFGLATAGALRAREDRIIAAVARHPSPVTVTTRAALPRLAWRADDRLQWMLTDERRLATVLRHLREQGVAEVAVITGLDVPTSTLSAYPVIEEQREPALRDDGLRIVVVRA